MIGFTEPLIKSIHIAAIMKFNTTHPSKAFILLRHICIPITNHAIKPFRQMYLLEPCIPGDLVGFCANNELSRV